jgi:DNA repair protein RecN (Recombination protein N)
MLCHLSIQNYALIEKIEIDFAGGLTIITGETGAGKSILLGALSLMAGSRADSSALQDKNKKCIVEGNFDITNYQLETFFTASGLDYADQTIIRREISIEGKSRAFINDSPVNLAQLRGLALQLMDIHSQHETLVLNESDYQLSVVDAFAETSVSVSMYKAAYLKYREQDRALLQLIEKEKQSRLDADYWQFQFDELEEADLKEGEQEEIEKELKMLTNSEEIKSVLSRCAASLNGGEMNVVSSLSGIKVLLAEISSFNPLYAAILERLNSSYIELKDLANEIEQSEEKTNYNPALSEKLTQRIDVIYRLQKKHQVNSTAALLDVKRKAEDRLKDIFSLENEITALRKEVEEGRQKLFLQAHKIAAIRKKCLPGFEKEVASLLSLLAMPNARFKVEHILLDTLTETGTDKMRFLFSANKGRDMKDISKVASGGELSRLMLAIKSLIAKKTALPSIVFDEIDTGVSGAVAEQVGRMIYDMAGFMQVFCITHLPQIASKGTSHFTVYKEEAEGKTVTSIKSLSKEGRIKEIASMLSAGKVTEASVKNAKELLKLSEPLNEVGK